MSTQITISAGGASQVVSTSTTPATTINVQGVNVPIYRRSARTITADGSAVAADKFKWLFLDGSSAAVTLTIDPSLFSGYELRIRCTDATNTVSVAQSSGNIELANGIDQASVQLLKRQVIKFYSDGTKLIEV